MQDHSAGRSAPEFLAGRSPAWLTWGLAGVALTGTVLGWRLFWFLTDDAFIAFRYVSNSVAGRGYVWNPAPFAAVEGYSSFLWVALLDLVWRVTGIEPPECANWISLVFGLATLFVGYRILDRVLGGSAGDRRAWFSRVIVSMVLVLTLTNRTFLAWLSSGLETAMFNFFLTWWVYEMLAADGRETRWWPWRLCWCVAFLALSRPEGLLFLAATLLTVAVGFVLRRRVNAGLRALPACLPLLIPLLHLVWRRQFYGYWLPNTYYAKVSGAWPEAGARYLASFVIEYGLWVPLLVAVAWLIRTGFRGVIARGHRQPALVILLAALGGQILYYTFIVGGDHFEYRVYSHLPLLAGIGAAAAAVGVARRSRLAVVLLGSCLLVSWPVPWTHWAQTHDLVTREETHALRSAVAPRFPAPMRPLLSRWDRMQDWLIRRHVCMRHQEHKIYYEYQASLHPTRAVGSRIPWEGYPTTSSGNVGVLGWILPNVAVIDGAGLNDRIVARTPPIVPKDGVRLMAHEHRPPRGYTRCFMCNVGIRDGRIIRGERPFPLSEQMIRDAERMDRWLGDARPIRPR